MKIKDNILNYLYDRDYIISMYDNYFYIFNYKYLESFNNDLISVRLNSKRINIIGRDLLIVKITKEELLIKGIVEKVEVEAKNE